MAEQNKQPANPRGGTQGGEAARPLETETGGDGTPGVGAPSGGVLVEPPAQYTPRTGSADRPPGEGEFLAGGKTVAQIRGYLDGVEYPANKEDIVRAAHRRGAPEDVLDALRLLGRAHYASFEEVASDYPPLPDREEIKGRPTPAPAGGRRPERAPGGS